MRLKLITCTALALLAALPEVKASTNVLTAWTFDNLSVAPNGSPQPSTGFGSASALGMNNSYNGTNSVSNAQIVDLPGSSTGGPNAWQISGGGAAPSGGNGWSTQAPIGSQGAQFAGGTAGYYRILVSFDAYATADAEANLQVQYTTEGSIWHNATITSAGAGTINNNSNTNLSIVIGSYITLVSGWDNQIVVDLSGISGVDNNPSFAIRLVNAASGTNCVNTGGTIYNNTSGSWSFDNVVIQGVSIDTIAEWTFLSYGATNAAAPINSPVPDIDPSGNPSTAQIIGFNLPSVIFSDGSHGSTNFADVLSQTGSSSSPGNPYCWRLRGQNPGNGWYTGEPIGSQGGEFDVSTVNYSNVVLSFDVYFTSQAEAKMCVLYTTDGWTNSAVADTLYYGANPNFVVTNDPASPEYSANTVSGTFFYETLGQGWYNNWVVDFTGVPGVDNNPYFGVRYVNAATAGDCTAYNGGSYNNSSGNSRMANVNFGGQFSGSIPPSLASAPNATVDAPWTNTFSPDSPGWRSSITAIYVNGVVLTNSASYSTNTAGAIVFTPSKDSVLQVAGVDTIVIYAADYGQVKITQPVAAGAFKKFATAIQPLGPSASGGTLTVNPMFTLSDQYGNTTTNPYYNVVVTASVTNSTNWILGGSTVQPEVGGVITFTNLSATVVGSSAVAGAVINVTLTGYTNSANSSTTTNFPLNSFNIGKPPVPFTPGNLVALQIDTLSNNTTFSLIEVKPSTASQSTAVNIAPVPATGPNALRQAPAGTTGRLCLSDDGTLLCFAAFVDGSSATADETFNLSRAAAGVNYTNLLTIGATYTSLSLAGSQARAACTFDDTSWIIDDKGGIYEGSGFINSPNVNALNNVVVKTFGQGAATGYPGYPGGAANGHTPYVETQKTANGSPIPVVYQLTYDSDNGLFDIEQGNNLGTDPVASDFYLISTNAGQTFDIMYTLDQTSSSVGQVNKYSWVNGAGSGGGYGWASSGFFTNSTGVDGLVVVTNGSGGAYIYYTTGSGGTGGNSIVRVTDAAGWNQSINIISSSVIYTAAKTVSIKGLTFTPQQTAYASQLIPTPLLTPQTGANVGAPFSITNTPDDAGWRAAINLVTVNGSTLPTAAYSTNQAGMIIFNPAQSALLQTTGAKTIGFSATGYISNSVVQSLAAGPAAQLVVTTQPTAPAASGGALAHQPVVKVEDAFNNVVTNNTTVTAASGQNTWTLGGSTNVGTSAGVATYAGLTAFSPNGVVGATITFTAGALATNSAPFNIPAPIPSSLGRATVAGGSFSFAFTNITGLSFSVLATNDITVPLSQWPVLGKTTEFPAGSGIYTFTNAVGTNSDMFYILRQP